MWISKCFEFSTGGHFIPSIVPPGQQVTSDPCLETLGLLSLKSESLASAKHEVSVYRDKIIFVMSGLLKIDDIYYRQRQC